MANAYGASLYVSYARADEKRHGTVAKLYQAYQATWVNLKVDADVVKPRESFKDFIEDLGKADSVIVLLSDAYFRSFYCMLELTRIMAFGLAKDRVFPVFLDDFRLDDKPRKLKAQWQQKLQNWRQPYDLSECAEEYGSEAECQAIVESCDAIFTSFAYNQAYTPDTLANDNFKVIIQWSKDRYLLACRQNPVFKQSITQLSISSAAVKDALKAQIKDTSIALSDDNIIAWLVQNHPTELLTIIANAQAAVASLENKQSLSSLIKLLLPLLFDPAYVALFNAQKERVTILQIPYATHVSAEVLMASADRRALELYVRKVSARSDANESMPGRYHLGSPPEGGENAGQTLLEYTEQHLKNLMGGSDQPSIELMQNQLFMDHVKGKIPGKVYSEDFKKQRINHALEKINAHYYWIMPLDQDPTWNSFAEELHMRYPKIIVLRLDNSDEKEAAEADLFDPLHQVISH